MRSVALAGLVVVACGGGGAAVPAERAGPPVTPVSCEVRYDEGEVPEAEGPVAEALAAWTAAARRGDLGRLDAAVDAETVERVAAGLERRVPATPPPARSSLAGSLAGLLAAPPCDVTWYVEERFFIQPALDDDTEPQARAAAAAAEALDGAMQVIGTCDGCPQLALALRYDGGEIVPLAWAPLGVGPPGVGR